MGGRGGAGGSVASIPTSERVRIKYSEYVQKYADESRKVPESYDKDTKTIEVDINPRIYEMAKMIPDEVYRKWADHNYEGGIKELSQYGEGYRATCAKEIYKSFTSDLSRRRLQQGNTASIFSYTNWSVLGNGKAVSKSDERWMRKALKMAVYGKK